MVLAATNYPWQIDEALRRWGAPGERRVGGCIIHSAQQGSSSGLTIAGGLVDVQHGKQSLRPPFSLSPSLRPPRRLEKRIYIGLPNFEERVALLKLKLKARQRQGAHSRWLPRACAARSSAAGARSWLFTFQLG